jgi:hypothetical protein
LALLILLPTLPLASLLLLAGLLLSAALLAALLLTALLLLAGLLVRLLVHFYFLSNAGSGRHLMLRPTAEPTRAAVLFHARAFKQNM